MRLTCPQCKALTIKKNGSIHNGKQKYECLACHRQFIEDPQLKQISEEIKERVRQIVILEADELWSYVGNKQNQQWLWLVMHSKSRQIVAFHVGDRSKASGQALMAKLPEDLKKSRLSHR